MSFLRVLLKIILVQQYGRQSLALPEENPICASCYSNLQNQAFFPNLETVQNNSFSCGDVFSRRNMSRRASTISLSILRKFPGITLKDQRGKDFDLRDNS